MLAEFVAVNRAELISRCRAKVVGRSDAGAANAGMDRGVPMFLDQLLEELRHGTSADEDIARTAAQHGHDLLVQGYTVSQVVHDYGDICQAITELAVEREAAISTGDFRTLNRCLDDAIAGAVTEYGRERDLPGEGPRSDGRHAAVARDLLKTIDISKVAFAAITSGKVGVAGSTGTVLSLALDTARDLAERLLAEPGAPGGAGGTNADGA
jgi:hypothetical protein